MVDSDVMIRHIRGFAEAQTWFFQHHARITISGYVALELLNGCQNKRELTSIQNFLDSLKIVWLKPAQATIAMQVFEAVHLKNKIGIIGLCRKTPSFSYGDIRHCASARR